MNIFALSGLINAISVSILGLFVYFKNRTNKINKKYALFCLCTVFWSFNYLLWQMAKESQVALFFCRGLMAGAIFIPILFLHFVLFLLGIAEQKRKIIGFGYCIFFIFFILNFTPLFVKGVGPKLSFPFWPEAGIAFAPFLLFWIWHCIYPCILLFRGFRQNIGIKRNQIRYVLLGILIGYFGGSTNYFLWYDIHIMPYGNFLIASSVIIMAYGIVAHRLMDINVIITRGLAYTGITVVIAGAYIGMMAGVDRIFAGVVGYSPTWAHSLLFIVVLFALIYVLPQMKTRALEITRKALFRGKYDYQQELAEATRKIPTILNRKELAHYILDKIRDTMMVNRLAIFIFDETEHTYPALASFGLDKKIVTRIKIGENSALPSLLRNNNSPLVKEELKRTGMVPEAATKLVLEQLDFLDAELCIPLMVRDDLTGIITLSNKKSGEMHTDEDLTLLSTLANQVALTVEYIKAIDKITTEKRYVGLGKAAMRMAHDIKNPLVPLKAFLQLLPDKYPNEFKQMGEIDQEFTGRFYESALDGVDRINLLIERALHYSSHPEPVFSRVRMNDILDEVLNQGDAGLKQWNINLKRKYDTSDTFIMADGEQLIELFSNLIANSIEAMEGVKSRTLFITTQSVNDRVAAEIIDSGCGIPKDKIDTIFDPFITYKHKGSGLGLAIAKKIVDDHKGIIEVSSQPGRGTSFKVILPKK
ncbi:MAG: GAF domain-containing protein [Candidatus Omnitrophica bacterium]|nr:GAF domain-containing protein [Candidatus Omnitrophota bacterium]